MADMETLKPTPWDRKALGIATYEITAPTEQALEAAAGIPGHFTVKIDPVQSKELLHRYGFYYCDTLLEPYCRRQEFAGHFDAGVRVSHEVALDEILGISHGAFEHGRFHRDFNVKRELADLRYDNWVRQLFEAGNLFGLLYRGDLAAFFGMNGSRVVLHAVHERFRGKGLAKYLWTAGIMELFAAGHPEVTSSVSAANTAVVNLYASLGFRFRNPVDVYHRLTV